MKFKTVKIGGKQYPVFYGMAAFVQISDRYGVESDNLFSALSITKQKDRIGLAHIGMTEGQRLSGSTNEVPTDETAFYDLLDLRPEALEEIIGVYYLETYGQKIETLLKEMDKSDNKKVKEAVDNLKNVWPVLTEAASKLPSADYTK